MDGIINLLILFGAAAVGFGLMYALFRGKKFIDLEKKKEEALNMVNKSKEEAEIISKENEERIKRLEESSREEKKRREQRIERINESLTYKEKNLHRKENRVSEVKLKVASLEEEAQSLENSINRIEKDKITKLTDKSGASIDKLKSDIINKYEKELQQENIEKLKNEEDRLKEDAQKLARLIIVEVIQRLCSPTSVETRAVLIKVPKDQIKGKIVGKGGRNIKFLEELFDDTSIVFNDLPMTISVSCYNLVQRRIAQKTIEKLIRVKGGIDENVIKKSKFEAQREMEKELFETGREAIEKTGFKQKLDNDLLKTIGRLKYRTSYGQNIMKHSMEVAFLSTMIGNELGLDTNILRSAGLLHDLGKAIDQDPNVKDAHDKLTKELMEQYGFSEEEVHAAWAHHDAEDQKTPEALIIKAADAISAGRPGARQESLHQYSERINALEENAGSFEGVDKAFAISAGREVRVIVNPEEVNDRKTKNLAKDIAEKIENNVGYPGKIKINVIRRMEFKETANKDKQAKPAR